jgi:hypothetical protein
VGGAIAGCSYCFLLLRQGRHQRAWMRYAHQLAGEVLTLRSESGGRPSFSIVFLLHVRLWQRTRFRLRNAQLHLAEYCTMAGPADVGTNSRGGASRGEGDEEDDEGGRLAQQLGPPHLHLEHPTCKELSSY